MEYKAGVLGREISYSLSPQIQKLFAKAADIEIDYKIYDVEDDPIAFIYDFFKKGGIGLNITKPYKEIVAQEFSKSLETLPKSGFWEHKNLNLRECTM